MIWAAGCASTRLPAASDTTAVDAGEKVIVLLRVVAADESQQRLEPFGSVTADNNISFGLGSFDTGGEPERLQSQRFLSKESRATGWTYFVLPPGLYYLAIYPPRHTDIASFRRSLRNAARWRLDVPASARLLYAGTLHLTGGSNKVIFGGRVLSSIDDHCISVADERDLVQALTGEHFPAWGKPRVALLQRHQGPIILRSPVPPPGQPR